MTGVMCMKVLLLIIVCNNDPYSSATSITKELANPHPKYGLSTMKKYGPDTIVLGGTNYLYRINMNDLEKEVEKDIGPRPDNPDCYNLENDLCNKKNYDSYIKALLIHSNKRLQQDEIIICTSLFQGSCGKRNVTTLELLPGYSDMPTRKEPVVANNKSATTVAFLAPGPNTDGTTSSTAMYVGASWTNTGLRAIRSLVPAFSSRNTENFSFTYMDVATKSYIMVDEINRDSFPIRYIYGFASGDFSYIGTIQQQAELRCELNGNTYNLLLTAHISKPGKHLAATLGISKDEDVLFGIFGYGHPNDPIDNNRESAMCIYPIRKVNQVFTLNIKTCFKGTGKTGPGHISAPRNCQSTPFDIDDNYCGKYDLNSPIDGPESVRAFSAKKINTTASSLMVTTTHADFTVAFVGTTTGYIKKVSIESSSIANEYDDVAVDPGYPILKDMIFDKDDQHLYVLTPNKLVKMVVQNCSHYTTCEECKGSNDPFCGWCSLENKCTLAQECLEYNTDLKWLGYNGKSCTKISKMYPDKIHTDKKEGKPATLTLNISNLPTYNGSYKCAFNGYGKRIETAAKRISPNVVKCDTPVPNELPPFPLETDYVTMGISVVIMEFDLVSANFTFFDCGVHTNCYSCTTSLFNCTWCIKNHLCTHYPVVDCSINDDLIAGRNSAGMLVPHVSGPNSCPSIDPSSRQNFVVSSGTEKIISISIKNLQRYQKAIRCAFANISQTEQQGEIANTVNNGVEIIVKCKQTRFFYPGDSGCIKVPLQILWGDLYPKPLDNPHNVQVIIYKCENMARSCGECLTQNAVYSCGWCKTSNQCSIQSVCTSPDNWLPNTENCPNPRITKIYPLYGPKEGGTILTIEGIDLGKSYEDIYSNVDIAGVQCSPIREEYMISKKIVCMTGAYNGPDKKKADHVRVTVALTLTATSKEQFTYVDPDIIDITPSQGPKSGGTKVTIFGKYLNAGTSKKAYFGNETFKCKLIQESTFSSNVTCVTAPSNSSFTTGLLYMNFDHQRVNSNCTYRYTENPNITEVSRRISIISGGLMVLVRGNGFIPIKTSSPKMVFYRRDPNQTISAYYGECLVLNDVTMECSTPRVEPSMVTKQPDTPDKRGVAFGFVIDHVQNIRNFSATHGVFFQICEDPEISVFPNDKIKSYHEYLTISGTNLDQIQLELDDVVIKVGKGECYMTSTGKQLTCQPPRKPPSPKKSGLYPEVEVRIGRNLDFFVGFLKYDDTYLAAPSESIKLHIFILLTYCMHLIYYTFV